MDFIPILLTTTLAAELLLAVGLLVSVFAPEHRIWPPPGRRSWQFWYVWILFTVAALGLTTLAVLDWNSFVFPDWLRYAVGLPLLVGGLALAFWGSGVLGWRRTSGRAGELKTDGLYRWSRNPQYLGDIANFLGLVLFSNATSALTPGLLAAALFALWPLSEEPWLRERFGEAYERYFERVPRFF